MTLRRAMLLSVAAVVLIFVAVAPAFAAPARPQPRTVDTTFRLRVSGHPDAGTTYWVAYGPLAGRFGILQLHPERPGIYSATRSLPATAQTTFSYLAGHGVVRTSAGSAPGNPVVTIRSIGSVTVSQFHPDVVRWSAPAG